MKPTVRLIDGRPYLQVDPSTVKGKYRDHLPHIEKRDDKTWALIADLERLSSGNRSECK